MNEEDAVQYFQRRILAKLFGCWLLSIKAAPKNVEVPGDSHFILSPQRQRQFLHRWFTFTERGLRQRSLQFYSKEVRRTLLLAKGFSTFCRQCRLSTYQCSRRPILSKRCLERKFIQKLKSKCDDDNRLRKRKYKIYHEVYTNHFNILKVFATTQRIQYKKFHQSIAYYRSHRLKYTFCKFIQSLC
jgi:hypothetical protein